MVQERSAKAVKMNDEPWVPKLQPAARTSNVVITNERLAATAPADQKKLLGEHLYDLILRTEFEEDAPKITGMILEMDNRDILDIINNHNLLMDAATDCKKAIERQVNAERGGEAMMAEPVSPMGDWSEVATPSAQR